MSLLRSRTASFVLGCLLASGLAAPAGKAQAPDTEAHGEVSVAAMGDILLHIKVVEAARAHGWDRVFGALAALLPDDDVALANLETPLVDDIRPVRTGSPPILGAPGEAAGALARAGVDVLACANNHAYDQRAMGLWRTLEALRAVGLVGAGAGRSQEAAFGPRVVVRQEQRVAVLSYTERVNTGPGSLPPAAHIARIDGQERLLAALRVARERADLVVLAVHWSHDFVDRPRRGQRRRARAWIEAGADLVVGTGPHVLQRVERVPSPRGEAVVAYSLGNLVSNQGKLYRPGRRASPRAHVALTLPETRDGLLLRARFRVEAGRVTVASLRGVPLWTENNHWEHARGAARDRDIRVIPLAYADEAVLRARLPAIRAAVGPAVELVGP